jgi:replicative DNA helicase
VNDLDGVALSESSNADFERALLGAVLSGYRGFPDLQRVVQGRDFRNTLHEEIWEAAGRVYASGGTVEPLTVRTALGEVVQRLPQGPLYLHTLMQDCLNVASAPHYAAQVADRAARNRIRQAGVAIIQLSETEREVDELAEDARQRLDQAVLEQDRGALKRVGDALPGVLDIAEHGSAKGLPTPWPDVDDLTRGLKPGRLVVIGARPGVGKSLMGANMAAHVASRFGHTAYVSSMELDETEYTQRILAAEAQVDLTKLENGHLSEAEWGKLSRATTSIQGWPLVIDDEPRQTVSRIRSRVRDLSRTQTVALVVVDYLQMLTPRDNRLPKREQIDESTRGLKLLAREFKVCVVAIASLNRGSVHRSDGKPTMGDLKESSGIESDADQVILLHPDPDSPAELQVLVEKHRNGPTGERRLIKQGHYSRLLSPAYMHQRDVS